VTITVVGHLIPDDGMNAIGSLMVLEAPDAHQPKSSTAPTLFTAMACGERSKSAI
jgi:hypothetical protein